MDQRVVLIPLTCPRCSTPVPAEPDQVAWACQNCGQGMLLDNEQGLQPLEILYSARITPNTSGRPFWVTSGTVQLDRQTFGSSKNRDAEEFWSQPRQFFVPAYPASLEDRLTEATRLIQDPPDLIPGQPARFEPPILDIQDVPAAAEFIVVAIEAGRRDMIKSVEMQLQLSKPILWILP